MASAPLQGTTSAAGAVKRVSYTHDAMIDLIVANPAISQNELSRHFGYTQGWLSRVMNSDAFQARLAERKGDMVDPAIVHNVEERFRGLAAQSAEILEQKLAATNSPELAFKVLELSAKSLGYGARQDRVAVQNNFVVHVPNKIEDPHAWAEAHKPAAAIIEG